MTALFLFAHQDDEVGVLHCIEKELRLGHRTVCCFLTDGGFGGISPQARNRESLAVLTALGVIADDIRFIGAAADIRDQHLHESLDSVHAALEETVATFREDIRAIYAPAWEGGHPDHDATHLLARKLASSLPQACDVWQFPLYHGEKCAGPFFRVLSPLPGNGEVTRERISWVKRGQYLMIAATRYPSMRGTWLGLLPFFFWRYLVSGVQSLQRADQSLCRPHPGRLYYEKRGFARFEEFWETTAAFRGSLQEGDKSGTKPNPD